MKAIMLSVRPEWLQKILSGEKTIEIRKTKPNCALPYKVYLYCVRNRHLGLVIGNGAADLFHTCNNECALVSGGYLGNGKVVAEFTLKQVDRYTAEFVDDDCYEDIRVYDFDEDVEEDCGTIVTSNERDNPSDCDLCKMSCMSYDQIKEHVGVNFHDKPFYAWHIADLKIYDQPKEVWEFKRKCGYEKICAHDNCNKCPYSCLHRAPQSWCHVKEQTEVQRG